MKLPTSATVLLAVLLLLLVATTTADVPPPTAGVPKICQTRCSGRCSKAGRHDRCLSVCYSCCKQCKDHCVPSGTSGHKEECPCYNNLKTKKGIPKCP
ncbi:Gibberellin-regulated protein 10 [Striga hermonthica]|uniref:Gibberellin-regulated protein 10 n=1 Tax=Striga hermonthica TaxID=68872 RepID=A0A9N7RF63_STRHE|nr:Gibberellin-regulated protein 10 [Striga hermonthica]